MYRSDIFVQIELFQFFKKIRHRITGVALTADEPSEYQSAACLNIFELIGITANKCGNWRQLAVVPVSASYKISDV